MLNYACFHESVEEDSYFSEKRKFYAAMAKSLVAQLCFQQKCPRFNPLSPIVTIKLLKKKKKNLLAVMKRVRLYHLNFLDLNVIQIFIVHVLGCPKNISCHWFNLVCKLDIYIYIYKDFYFLISTIVSLWFVSFLNLENWKEKQWREELFINLIRKLKHNAMAWWACITRLKIWSWVP